MSDNLLRSLFTHDCKLCVLSDRSFTSCHFHICAICSSTSHHILCPWFLFLERYKAQWLMVTCSVCLVEKMQETQTLCKCSSNPINSTVSACNHASMQTTICTPTTDQHFRDPQDNRGVKMLRHLSIKAVLSSQSQCLVL